MTEDMHLRVLVQKFKPRYNFTRNLAWHFQFYSRNF
jgi:hypothetical protein